MDKKKLLRDFFDGKLSRVEAELFLQWFLSEQGKKDIANEIKDEWMDLDQVYPNYSWEGKHLLKTILETKEEKSADMDGPPKTASKKNTSGNGFIARWKWAAGISLVMVFSFIYYMHSPTEPDEKTEEIPASIAMVIKSNPAGQKSRIYLSDGSIVYLNAESSLKYEENFQNGRIVHLSGEAYFEIQSDSLNPFIVYSSRIATIAKGTAFNIKAYHDNKSVEVVLASGIITVKDSISNDSLLLNPGEGTRVLDKTLSLVKHKVNLEEAYLWKEGILHFEKVPFLELIQILERWYGVSISLTGNIPNEKCSGKFKKNEYLTNVLNVLSHSLEFEYAIQHKEVKIGFNPL